MAGKRLQWVFELFDKVSKPAKAMQKALGAFEEETEKSKKTFESFAVRMEAGFRLGERAFHLAEGFAEVGMSMAEAAIHAASFKETTLVSLETVLGSSGKAKKVLQDTVALAAHLPIETEQAIQAVSKLAMAGFNTQEQQILAVAAADVKAMNGGKEESFDVFLRQIAEMRQVGLSNRHLLALSQELNLPTPQIFENLGKLTGRKGDEKFWEEAISKRAIPRDVAIKAIIDTIAQKQGGAIGNLSNRLSTTVPGLLSTLKSRKLEFLMDLDESPAYASFRGFLGNLAKLLDPNSRFGARVKSAITRTFNSTFGVLFGDFAGDAGAANLEKLLEKVLRGAQLVGVAFQGAAAFARGFSNDLLDALGMSGDLFGPDGTLDQKKVSALVAKFEDFGHKVAKVVELVAGAIDKVATLVTTVADNQANPSKFKRYMLAPGLTFDYDPENPLSNSGLGVFEGNSLGEKLTGASIDDQIKSVKSFFGGGGAQAAGGRGGVNLTVQVHAPGATRDDAREIERHAEMGARKALDTAHDHLALSPG